MSEGEWGRSYQLGEALPASLDHRLLQKGWKKENHKGENPEPTKTVHLNPLKTAEKSFQGIY